MSPISTNSIRKTVKKTCRGPKAKPIAERTIHEADMRPIIRPEIYWSHRQQVRVLVFLANHQIPTGDTLYPYRYPTQREASEVFRVPQPTISGWVSRQEKIETFGNGFKARSLWSREVETMRWPELESRLYQLFLE